MIDITPDDIASLNDTDLRELVARLCEAELLSRGLSPVAVTWGGSQTAPDGGLDVRVELPPQTTIGGYIPSKITGFQVKKPDMPPAAIKKEMRPNGKLRPVIQELAMEKGAYIIVSSSASTTDISLQHRHNALRQALKDAQQGDQLYTDFYDRTRLTSWVRTLPSVIPWIRAKVGKSIVGWQPYNSWCSAAEDIESEYLKDETIRLHFKQSRGKSSYSLTEGIDLFRDILAEPNRLVRLVGLSGVGKTRLAQALFDNRIGNRPLPPQLALYTNCSDNPQPQPIALITDLKQHQVRAIIIIDNCPPELHNRLSEICIGNDSELSILTIEYDIREDQPESTEVIQLDAASPKLTSQLIKQRFQTISEVDAETIATFSGGNARVAIALAQTVKRSEPISHLSNNELFERLFLQRNKSDEGLLYAAQACSLVYSFQGEALSGEDAEIPLLASLASQEPSQLYRHISELIRRNLAQERGVWRAILPHAIANRLASRALEEIPFEIINKNIIQNKNERLTRSFARRLSFLHAHPKAIQIVKEWLSPEGLLGNIVSFNDFKQAMFINIASVIPEKTLEVLETLGDNTSLQEAAKIWWHYKDILRSLAYDPTLFDRSCNLLVQAILLGRNPTENQQYSDREFDIFTSLFTLYLSGTQAPIAQRLDMINLLLTTGRVEAQELGLKALAQTLRTSYFSSGYRFDFGARSRDYGYEPQNSEDVYHWYSTVLIYIEKTISRGLLVQQLRTLIAQNIRNLWNDIHLYDQLETLTTACISHGFWREGWIAYRQIMKFDDNKSSPEALTKLHHLETLTRPKSLYDQIETFVLGDPQKQFSINDVEVEFGSTEPYTRIITNARNLGIAVVKDDATFQRVLPKLFHASWQAWHFGSGLASSSPEPVITWNRLVKQLEETHQDVQDISILCGFLEELNQTQRDTVQLLLDLANDHPILIRFLPQLHTAIPLDQRGIERLIYRLVSGEIPIGNFYCFTYGKGAQTIAELSAHLLKEFISQLMQYKDGYHIAIDVLHMRLEGEHSKNGTYNLELLEVAQEVIRYTDFDNLSQRSNYGLAYILEFYLQSIESVPIIKEFTARLRQAVLAHKFSDANRFLSLLFEYQPQATLDALFTGDEEDQYVRLYCFTYVRDRDNPSYAIPDEVLIRWCKADSSYRYPLAASIIPFVEHTKDGNILFWSKQAKSLLLQASDLEKVLSTFINRFEPMSWVGSRATIMESYMPLFDQLEELVPSDLLPFVQESKTRFKRVIAKEVHEEEKYNHKHHESFE